MPEIVSWSSAFSCASRVRTSRYARRDRFADGHRRSDEEGQHGEDDHGEAEVQEQHHGDHPGERDDVAQDGDRPGREHLADRLHVAQDSRHDAPDGVPVEERGREALDVGEEGGAQVVDDALTGPCREVDLRIAQRVLDGQGHREEPDDPGEPGPVSLEDVFVDGDLDQVRLDEVHRRQQREQGRREGDRPRYGRVKAHTRPASRASYTRPAASSSSHGPAGRGLTALPRGGSTSSGGLDRRLELLAPPQARVEPPAGEELRVGALLHEAALVQDDDAIEHRGDAETVGDDQRGALADAAEEAGEDRRLGLGVDGGEGVVENQYPGVAQERTRQGRPLALTARERQAALADHRVPPGRQPRHVGREARHVRRGLATPVSGAPKATFSRSVREKRNASWGTKPIAARRSRAGSCGSPARR